MNPKPTCSPPSPGMCKHVQGRASHTLTWPDSDLRPSFRLSLRIIFLAMSLASQRQPVSKKSVPPSAFLFGGNSELGPPIIHLSTPSFSTASAAWWRVACGACHTAHFPSNHPSRPHTPLHLLYRYLSWVWRRWWLTVSFWGNFDLFFLHRRIVRFRCVV